MSGDGEEGVLGSERMDSAWCRELYASGSGLSIGEPERFSALVEENMNMMPVRGFEGLGGGKGEILIGE